MLWNSKVTVSGLQLSSASRSEVVEQSVTMMVSSSDVQFYCEGRLGLGGAGDKKVQIITLLIEQLLINPAWIRRSLGDQIQIGLEFVRFNQVVNPMRGLWRRGSEMEMKSRVVQLWIDVITWNMMAILGIGCIQVKREIVRIVTRIHHEDKGRFRDQEQTGLHSWFIG